ncbi:thermonuclease family protein [Campylobacter sp. 9BO]|uniref:thermonuclease family protein n=1 Tax=Campylobacter sp. 9BO TaxID=3424759 RepID=UPI003D345A76
MKQIFTLLLFCITLLAKTITITHIHDGDTIVILTEQNEQVKVRLHGINAPELKKPYGKAAKKHLMKLTKKGVIELKIKGFDKYNRTLGVLYKGTQDLNAKMVQDGYAKAYTRFSKDYVKEQKEAKKSQTWDVAKTLIFKV